MTTMVSKNKHILMPMIVPMLQERQKMFEQYGDSWEDKPVRLEYFLHTDKC